MTDQPPDLLMSTDEIQALIPDPLPTELLLAVATQISSAVREYCGWRIAKPANQTFILTARDHHKVFIPTLRLNSVASVTSDGTVLDIDDQFEEYGVIDYAAARLSTRRRGLQIVVNHGFDTCPGLIAGAIGAAVARGVIPPAGNVISETTLSSSIRWGTGPDGSTARGIFLPSELATLDNFRIRRS